MLLPFHRQQGDVLFQHDNAHPRTAAATQRALRGVQLLPWLARTPDLSPIEHIWDMMKWELTLSLDPATTIAELRQRLRDVWENLRRMTFGTFKTICMREYTPALLLEVVHCVIM